MDENQRLQEIHNEFMQLIIDIKVKHDLSINVIYSLLAKSLCHIYKVVHSDVKQLLNDIETVFKSLPPPIEELDDNSDKQPDCQGT